MVEVETAETQVSLGKPERKVFELPVIEPARLIARNTFEIIVAKPSDFEFSAGQSMKFFPEEEYAGSFSIVSAPRQEYLTFAFRGSESPLKKRMLNLGKGAPVPIRDVKRVKDTFHYPEEPEADVPVVMIAGGIGITPFTSMLRHAALTNDKRSFTLLSTNPTEADAAYRDEIMRYPEFGVDIHQKYFFSGNAETEEKKHRFTSDTLAEYLKEPMPIFYVAGPVKMVQDTVSALRALGVPEKHIRFKEFTGYVGTDDVNR